MQLFYKILILACGVLVAGYFAGIETGLYRMSRFRLRLGVQQDLRFSRMLGQLITDTQGLILSILIGTNLTHYIITSIVTYMFLSASATGQTAELYAMLVTTPVLFIFSELIPKNLFIYHADFLMPRLAPGLWAFHRLCSFSRLLIVLKWMSKTLSALTKSPVSTPIAMAANHRHHMSQIIAETTEEGLLSSTQTGIINHLMNIPHIQTRLAMIPLAKVQMLSIFAGRAEVFRKLQQASFSRRPVFQETFGNIVGFVNIYETLTSREDFAEINSFVKPIISIVDTKPVLEALNILRNKNHKIALVTHHANNRPIGIVTVEDLAEKVIGELAR